MPPVILVALAGAGLLAGYKIVRAHLRLAAERAAEDARAAEVASRPPKDLGMLELDPATGDYRPQRRAVR